MVKYAIRKDKYYFKGSWSDQGVPKGERVEILSNEPYDLGEFKVGVPTSNECPEGSYTGFFRWFDIANPARDQAKRMKRGTVRLPKKSSE